jgi:hypothetical protein
MTQLDQISDLPLAEFSSVMSLDEISTGELRATVELLTHKIAVEQYGKEVVEAGAPAWEAVLVRARDDGGMSHIELVERVAHLALVLLGRFAPDDTVLFLSPTRVAAMAFDALPLSIDEVSSLVPVTDLKELGFENMRDLRNVKRLMSPTVKAFVSTGARHEQIDRWSALLPLIP